MIKFFFIALLVLTSGLYGSTVPISEQTLARALEYDLWKYHKLISQEPVTSWAQIAKVDSGLYGVNAVLKNGSVTEFFSFVPLAERGRFPLGNLILVQSKAMPWPDRWKMKDPDNSDDYLDHPGHQEIRFFVYEKNGKYIADRWYETKFQTMLAETGLTVPPPTPYYPPPPAPPSEKPAYIPSTPAPVVVPAAAPTPAPVAPPPAKSFNSLWWIIGAIAALAAVVFIMRKKKPEA